MMRLYVLFLDTYKKTLREGNLGCYKNALSLWGENNLKTAGGLQKPPFLKVLGKLYGVSNSAFLNSAAGAESEKKAEAM